MLLAGILIYLEDKGSIFYSQIRSGIYGKKIKIYKLRTMKINAEEDEFSGVLKMIKGLPR